MFFAAFFGALFYVRVIVNSWLGWRCGVSACLTIRPPMPPLRTMPCCGLAMKLSGRSMVTPDQAANGARSQFLVPEQSMSFPGWATLLQWLPLWNTVLLTSSFTVHIAHTGLKNTIARKFVTWLGITVALGSDLPGICRRKNILKPTSIWV